MHHSASDLSAAITCEWALMRVLDAKLGRIPAVEEPQDAMLERASVLGGLHEERALADFRARFGPYEPGRRGGVAEIPRADPPTDSVALAAAQDATVRALRDGADVVFQGTFSDGRFVGFADFLVRTATADGEVYEVYDTKLARKAKISALLQVAAYTLQLDSLGIPVGPQVHLLLGDGTTSTHRLEDVLPVYEERIGRLLTMIDARLADPEPLAWGAAGYAACGRCAACAEQVETTRDVLLVARLNTRQRARLAQVGIRTIDEFAASTGDVPGIGAATLEKLRDQARMQVSPQEPGGPSVRYRVHDTAGLAALPAPDAGDIFFDFEGDPLWTDGNPRFWGIEYLFGVVEHEGDELAFRPFWAHDRAEERQALLDFLEYVAERRRHYPALHIYHYADYERSHLQQLCARHGVGETLLDELLREHVFVDLYPIVLASIRISERSYSLKKLEPLYMGDELRVSDVTNAADSIVAYVDFTVLRDAGKTEEAREKLAEIAEYNRYDCLSTLRLRDWLLARADEAGVRRRPAGDPVPESDPDLVRQEERVRDRLLAAIEGVPVLERTPDQRTLAMAAAALEYHRREAKTYWWEHFNRHISPLEDWADTREVLVVERAELVSGWERRGRKKSDSRVIRLRGKLAPASRLGVGDSPQVMYADPVPIGCGSVPAGQRGEHGRSEVLAITELPDGTEVVLEETAGDGNDGWGALPIALTPAAPIRTDAQRGAILEWGRQVADGLPQLAPGAALDLLGRRAPRLRGGGGLPQLAHQPIDTVTAALLQLEHSALAVQGPPGSGKTYVGANVVARLVLEHGWTVGVVAQSHEVVENLLRRVVAAGVPAEQVAKRPSRQKGDAAASWTVLGENSSVMPFILQNRRRGFVLGGTAWDFSNASKVPRNVLDLLVIDEAGQFSLANTIAVSTSARRLLLLGDPQQLPQVSQGLHPEPVDESALGWLTDGHDVLPETLGYFLPESWRMHPDLCRAVSELAYEGRLSARLPETTDRFLDGVQPGLVPVPVASTGNSVESPEEAERVISLLRDLVGRPWSDARSGRVADPLRPSDVLVVAPYNAQVELLRRTLDAAGFSETPVGTVDKFQGQEAAVAIVSLTASTPDDAPRGIGFLLLRNRLNVAISRAQWAAYLLHSPALGEYLPYTAESLAELSAFLRLTSGAGTLPQEDGLRQVQPA